MENLDQQQFKLVPEFWWRNILDELEIPRRVHLGWWIVLGLTFTFTILGAFWAYLGTSAPDRAFCHLKAPIGTKSFENSNSSSSSEEENKRNNKLVSWIKRGKTNYWMDDWISFLTLTSEVVEEILKIRKDKFFIFCERKIILRILKAFLKPVLTKPRRRLDKIPPLVGEILHRPVRHRNEQGSVRIQHGNGRRRVSLSNNIHSRSLLNRSLKLEDEDLWRGWDEIYKNEKVK